MDKSDKLFAINQTLPGLECFLREVLGNEGLSSEAEDKRQDFLKRLEFISNPPSLPPRPPQLPPRLHLKDEESGSAATADPEDPFADSFYRNDTIHDPVAFASHQRELSRHYTFSKGYVGRGELLGEDSPLYAPQIPISSSTNYGQRDSIKSSSSDELYERLSFSEATCHHDNTPILEENNTSALQDASTISASNLGARGGNGRGSGGKGKLTSGWFKKEVKIYDTIHLTDITDPVIQGYLKDIKSKQRRWCVLKDDKLYIFKSRDEPCSQIIDLPNCDIGVDDKKKISYSFSLRQSGGPSVQLAIEEGHDLSPWMSAIMAAAVRRSSAYRPISPLENAFSIGKAQEKGKSPYGYMRINIHSDDNEDGGSSTYEVPMESFSEMLNSTGYQPKNATSTPVHADYSTNEPYNPPLPPLPIDSDSSSETSSDDEEDDEERISSRRERKISKANLLGDDIQDNDTKRHSLVDDWHGTDSPSDHSTHCLSYGESIASDEASETRGERAGSLRKRTSTVLSTVSLDSVGSGSEMPLKVQHPSRKTSVCNGPRIKRRRKQTSAESEAKFLQDPNALHSGVLFQKRPLGIWSKRYCKLVENKLKCFRHADDLKPSLIIDLHDHDVGLIDSKDSKKAYGFKISHPSLETFLFATDSRVAVERWIELISLAATGRQDIVALYPPYCKSDSGDELRTAKSQDSLTFSEGIESGDTLDFIDSSTPHSTRMDDDTSGYAADELDDDLSSDARDDSSVLSDTSNQRVKSPQRRSPRHYTGKGGARERAFKRKNEKNKSKVYSEESPYTSLSPTQSLIVSDSSGEGKPDGSEEHGNRVSNPDPKKEKPKGWADSLKLKQSLFVRGHSLSTLITGGTPTSEVSKTRLNTIKKTSIQSFSHLLSLFDKEGRFSGFLTEVKVSKYSRTQLRRWCVVKNGVLNLYNKQLTDEEPAMKLNLAEMWITESKDETKNKYIFELHGKDGGTFTFQVPEKDDFNKWVGVLKVFTEIRVERPTESTPVDEGDKSNEPKAPRPVSKGKEEGASLNTFVKRPSIRMKFSQKVNVMDIFKRSQVYDFENPSTGEVPTDDVKCIDFTGGYLTEVCVTDDHYTWSRVRWCTIKNSELLIFQDSESDEPIKRIVLYNIKIEESCEPDKDIYKFKIHKGDDTTILVTDCNLDYERWVKQLHNANLTYGKHDHEISKCRFPSPPRVFGHRRARSESLQKFGGSTTVSDISSTASSPEKRLSLLSFGSDLISTGSEGSTDTLMNGHLQEVVPSSTKQTADISSVTKWCSVTSEFFFVYDSDDSESPSQKLRLQELRVKEENVVHSTPLQGFSLQHEDQKMLFRHENQEVVSQWLSVLHRYCRPQQDKLSPLVGRSNPDDSKPKKSLSDGNLKGHLPAEQEKRFLRKTLSEGKASGRKLLRKISEDNLLHKYRRAELFKVPWKGSWEKVNVKLREHKQSPTSSLEMERRYSCGSLFDSEGKFSGYLVQLVARPLCRSEVRRWCVLCGESFYVYDQPRMETSRTFVELDRVELINESNFADNKFVFKLQSGKDDFLVFKASNRTEFEKWVTAISVKIAVLKSRMDRTERRRGLVIDEDEEPALPESESSTPRYSLASLAPPTVKSVTSSVTSDISSDTVTADETSVYRSFSNVSTDSVFSREYTQASSPSANKTTHDKQEVDRETRDKYSSSAEVVEDPKRISPVMAISQAVEEMTLQDGEQEATMRKEGSLINLGTFKVPWSAVESDDNLTVENDSEPIYQNISSDPIPPDDPVYQNIPQGSPEGSDTLSSITVEQIDVKSYEGKIQYRKFQKGMMDDSQESMFMDMLPKRNSEYDLGPLYENLQFLKKDNEEETHEKPLCSIRPSKDYEDVFVVGSNQNNGRLSNETNYKDRCSIASDYSGIVGEALLEEVGSFSGSTSRSGTLSSQTSANDPRDTAFDKELLGDILGLPVTPEEAADISEFCTKCDEETEIRRNSSDDRSSTLTNRHSDVFFDALNEIDVEVESDSHQTETEEACQDGKVTSSDVESCRERVKSGASGDGENEVHDTYFGASSSEDEDESYEDSSQGFLTAQSSPYRRRLSNDKNVNVDNPEYQSQNQFLDVLRSQDEICLSKEFSSKEDHLITSDVNQSLYDVPDPVEILKYEDDSIVSVGAVLPDDDKPTFFSARSSFDESGTEKTSISDTSSSPLVVLRNKSSFAHGSVRKELTKSQTEFIKAVTDAFEGIANLTFEEDDGEDTKL